MLPYDELEYGGIVDVLADLQERFRVRQAKKTKSADALAVSR
jgi:hypothetical protein